MHDKPAPRRGPIREVAWLIGAIWTLATAGMLLSMFVGSAEVTKLGYSRVLLMAPLGALLSILLWRVGSSGQRSTMQRLAIFILGVITVTGIHVLLDLGTARLLEHLLGEPSPVRRIISDNPVRTFLMSLLVRSNVAIFFAAHAFFGMAAVALTGAIESRDRDRLLASAEAAASAAQLTALRYQLNPHFLFNTLNAIGSLVESGRSADAGAMIDRLADFLRSTLAGQFDGLTNLDQELSTIHDYLAIESVRFGKRLVVEFDVPEDVRNAQVPSFILQPLVENAIRHAVAPAMGVVTVRIAAERDGEMLSLKIEDNGRSASGSVGTKGGGVGLRNTHERLNLLHGGKAALTSEPLDPGYRATVRLPFVAAGLEHA